MRVLSIQMTGVSVIQYYAPRIFESIGIDTSTTLGLQSGNSVIALIGEGLCIWFIDRLGRRGPFIWGNALSGLTFVIGTIIIAVFPAEANNHNAARTFVAMTWLVRRYLQRRSSHADRMYHCSSTWSSLRAAGLCLGRYAIVTVKLPLYSYGFHPDSRRDVQQCDTGQSYCNHLFCGLDFQLYVTTSDSLGMHADYHI